MRILMTADTVGGVWPYALDLCRGLARYGVEVALATFGAPLRDDQWREVLDLAHVEVFESDYKLIWMDDPWRDLTAAGAWLLHLARTWQPRLIHLNDYPHGPLPWPAPVLMVGHSCVLSWWQAVHGEPAPAAWQRYRQAVGRGLLAADRVVAPSQAMLDELARLYGPLPPSRMIANGRRRPPRTGTPREPLILAAGRIWDAAKNLKALARIAADLPWPVCLAGETRHPNGGVTGLGTVRLLGRLAADELQPWFERAAIYALPARYEPFGLSALEAAQNGCALVLGDIPSLREVWGDAARYVHPDDPAELRAVLRELIDDEPLRREYATRAEQRAARYTAERMAADYWNLYLQLAVNRTGRVRGPRPAVPAPA
jgi:glycogen(starch) synthase